MTLTLPPIKSIYLLLFFVLLSSGAKAQVEFILPYNDSTRSVNNVSHVVDGAGNVYLLSSKSVFYPSGVPFDFVESDIATAKVDKYNKISWAIYPTQNATDTIYAYNNKTATQIFMWNGNVAIPSTLDINYQACTNDSSLRYSSRSGMLILDTAGNLVTSKTFNDDSECGWQALYHTEQIAPNTFTFLYRSFGNYHVWLDERDSALTRTTFSTTPALDTVYPIVTFDTFAQTYITYDPNNLYVLDAKGILQRSIPLHLNEPVLQPELLAYNAGFYALMYTVKDGNSYAYALTVLSKNGDVISSVVVPELSVILLTADNQLWTLTKNTSNDATIQKPLLLTQTDLFQNVIRQKNIGFPLTYGSALSITNNNIVVTGTSSMGNGDYSRPHPGRAYFYRTAVSDIPAQPGTKTCCTDINIYPNPATNTLNIVSNSYTATYGANVTLYNTIGQRIGSYQWDQKQLNIDIHTLAAGVYYIRSYNAGKEICTQKIVKI